MKEFFILEGAYIVIGIFVVMITVFVTTRPFMSKTALKNGLSLVSIMIIVLIASHYYITTKRMKEVREAFLSNKEVLCENRIHTKAAQFVTIKKEYEWELKGNLFLSKNYTRPFHLARCIVK